MIHKYEEGRVIPYEAQNPFLRVMNDFEHRSAESVVIFEERIGFVRGGGQVGDYGIHQGLHSNISRTKFTYRSL